MKATKKIFEDKFNLEYRKLNKAQRQAVDTIDGPVMVVAGPGTGKTQILALRIANILQKTDIKADGILCLTFTNSAVDSMKDRLGRYIGEDGEKVNVFTFHSFGMQVVSEHFKVLGLKEAPKLLEDTQRAVFFEQILSEHEWDYLRPRGDSMRYFRDLMSLASILKRERISNEAFDSEIAKEMKFLEDDEESIASRGEHKGGIKKEVLKEIESLKRSREIVKFLDLYDQAKKEKNLLDYDDVLESLVKLVEISEDAKAAIRERYLYVLIDEHQDSSRVQNEFLARVWAKLTRPDIFVVGDDRQLIYGFSGASIDHFKGFRKTFPDAKLITLVDNYRSTQVILDASHALLKSVMSGEKLVSQSKEKHRINLVEVGTPEEEIMALGSDLKEKMQNLPARTGGLNPDDCALLVPKNRQVLGALEILHNMGIPVSTESISLFDQDDARAILRVLKIIDTGDKVSLALSFLHKTSGISIIDAHTFFAGEYMRDFSLEKLLSKPPTLFSQSKSVNEWIAKLSKWKDDSKENKKNNLEFLIQTIGEELFDGEGDGKKLVTSKEIVNTILGLLKKEAEKNSQITLSEFVSFLDKLASYGEYIPLVSAVSGGVKVLTMHSSKGLEFEYVWIAHMDEKSLSGGRRMGFTLPPAILERVEERDIDAIKRKLYVAITRAKRFCTLSYATFSGQGNEQELAKVIADLPNEVFQRQKKQKISYDEKVISKKNDLSDLIKLATEKYKDRYVSVSMLNNFFECPWKWYFRNLLQIPEPENENLIFGSLVHEGIDNIIKADKIILPKMILSEDKKVAEVVRAWADRRLSQIEKSRENEYPLSVADKKFPHLKIYGRIDLIEHLDAQSVRVTDFKTGAVRKKSDIEKVDEEGRISGYLRQLAMYSYLIKQSPKWKAGVKESRLEFVEAKNPAEAFYNTVITGEQIDFLLKDIKDYDTLIKTGEWIYRPCNYNSYGKNTECEYCKMAEMYKS